jgi:hypothetical protein
MAADLSKRASIDRLLHLFNRLVASHVGAGDPFRRNLVRLASDCRRTIERSAFVTRMRHLPRSGSASMMKPLCICQALGRLAITCADVGPPAGAP